MWNLMKALNYQVKRDNFVFGILMLLCVPEILTFVAAYGGSYSLDELTGCAMMAIMAGGMLIQMGIAWFSVIMVARIVGWDMNDKTINYEILAGHSRLRVYASRTLVSVLWNTVIVTGVIAFLIGFPTILNGWGDNMDRSDMMIRLVLLIFPIIQMECEMILLTFLLKNCYLAMVIGYVFSFVVNFGVIIYTETAGNIPGCGFVLMTIGKLMDFSNYKLKYIGGKDIPVYDMTIGTGLAAEVIGVSVILAVVCLVIGYRVFRKQDMS